MAPRGLALMVVAAVLVAGCGGASRAPASPAAPLASGPPTASSVTRADLPPVGAIWFGSTVDRQTFAITGRLTSVSGQQEFSLVAHLAQPMDGSTLAIRTWFNGRVVGSIPLGEPGMGDIWGSSPRPLQSAGRWRFDMTDVDGNVLATGELTVTP
jgi:hypothetical protein